MGREPNEREPCMGGTQHEKEPCMWMDPEWGEELQVGDLRERNLHVYEVTLEIRDPHGRDPHGRDPI